MKFNSLILLLAAPALLLCACQKTRVAQQAENISRELTDGHIVFSASADAATRAVQGSMTESTAATVQSGGFKVAGVIGTDTYFNETASWDGTNSWYATANTYYYPTTSAINFYAVHPASQAITVSSGAATLSYTSDGTTDLIAKKVTVEAGGSGSTALAFDHILSQVKIACHGSDALCTYTVTDIKLSSKTSGVYAYSSDSWGSLGADTEWDLLDAATAASTATGVFSAMGSTPTVVPGACTVEISWDTYQGGAKVASYTVESDAFTPTKGKQCTVNCTLPNSAAEAITFTISVNAWGTESRDLTLD